MTILSELRRLSVNRPMTLTEARVVAERQARRLRQRLDVDDEYTFPATTIGELPNIDVLLEHDETFNESGITGWNPKRRSWQILINNEHHVHRQRFTLLHEYKHIVDYPIYKYAYPDVGAIASRERQEAICDYFAACVLMPKLLVRRAWTEHRQDPRGLARLFGVSPAAMRYRLHDLGLIEPNRHPQQFFRTQPEAPPAILPTASAA